jgi:uncharacterized phage protein gp47/JayE
MPSPYARPTLQQLYDRILADLGTRPGVDTFLRVAFERILAKALAGGFNGLYGYLDWIALQVNPRTCGEEVLLLWCSAYRVARKTKQKSVGNGVFSGTNGTAFELGKIVQRADGVRYVVVGSDTVASGTVTIGLRAEIAGIAGNTLGSTPLRLVSPIAGIQSLGAFDASGASGGLDLEDIEDWRVRLLDKMANPERGGMSDDYKIWAKATPTVDVENVYVYPYYDGPGTVAIAFTVDADDPIPTEPNRAAVEDYVEPFTPEDMAGFRVILLEPDPVTYVIQVRPHNPEMEAAIMAALKDLHRREAVAGGTFLISKIREAVSGVAGEDDSVITTPAADFVPASTIHLPTYDADLVTITELA